MSTRRALQMEDDEELRRLNNGDVVGAQQVARRKRIDQEEERAVDLFMADHPEIAPVDANRALLLNMARGFGGVVNTEILSLALAKIGVGLAITPPAPPELTPEEIAELERKRLLSMSLDELRQEARRTRPRVSSAINRVSPEVEALKSRSDVLKLSAEQLRALTCRDGLHRRANIVRINELLKQGN